MLYTFMCIDAYILISACADVYILVHIPEYILVYMYTCVLYIHSFALSLTCVGQYSTLYEMRVFNDFK
jgi:hypothetical protein